MITWDPETKAAFWENGVYVGDILMDVDGFYKWGPKENGGYLDEWFLYCMFTKLKEMNKKWQEQLDNDPVCGYGSNNLEQWEPIR